MEEITLTKHEELLATVLSNGDLKIYNEAKKKIMEEKRAEAEKTAAAKQPEAEAKKQVDFSTAMRGSKEERLEAIKHMIGNLTGEKENGH